MKRSLPVFVGLLLASVAAAQPVQVYYRGRNNELHCLDTSTGVPSPILTGAWSVSGLADDPTTGVFYATDGTQLTMWDPSLPAAPSLVAQTTLSGVPYPLDGLAHLGGVLIGSSTIGTEGLYTVDIVTGALTLVYAFTTSDIDIGGLDIDPATSIVFGTNDSPTYIDTIGQLGRGLVAMLIAPPTIEIILAPYPAGRTDIDGLAFVSTPAPGGSLYLVEDEPAPIQIYDLNTATYAPNPPPNAFTFVDDVAGATSGVQLVGSIGTSYCTANPNSTGTAASIEATGSRSVALNNVALTARALPSNSFGYFLTSMTQGFVPNPGGSAGNLCLGGAVGRYLGPGQVQNSGAVGTFSLAIDLTQHPTPGGFVPVSAGQTWNFTAWFRDALGGSATSNFTNGTAVDFQP